MKNMLSRTVLVLSFLCLMALPKKSFCYDIESMSISYFIHAVTGEAVVSLTINLSNPKNATSGNIEFNIAGLTAQIGIGANETSVTSVFVIAASAIADYPKLYAECIVCSDVIPCRIDGCYIVVDPKYDCC